MDQNTETKVYSRHRMLALVHVYLTDQVYIIYYYTNQSHVKQGLIASICAFNSWSIHFPIYQHKWPNNARTKSSMRKLCIQQITWPSGTCQWLNISSLCPRPALWGPLPPRGQRGFPHSMAQLFQKNPGQPVSCTIHPMCYSDTCKVENTVKSLI